MTSLYLLQCIKLDRSDPDMRSMLRPLLGNHPRTGGTDCNTTISVHNVHSLVYRKKRGGQVNLHVSKSDDAAIVANFFILAKGTPSDVVLPQIKYDDPLNRWRSETREAVDDAVNASVEKEWQRGCEDFQTKSGRTFKGKMAKFSVRLQNERGDIEPLTLDMKDDFARKKKVRDDKNASILDVWAHSPRINALYHHIVDETKTGKSDLDDISKQFNNLPEKRKDNLMEEEFIKEFINKYKLGQHENLPMSFKHPTIQIQHSFLPVIKQLGSGSQNQDINGNLVSTVAGRLVRDRDNRAHLKAAQPGQKPRQLTAEHMRQLITHHEEQKRRKF